MNTRSLLNELASAGIHLWEDSGQLRYRAPRGALTPERLAELRAAKEELLATLRGDRLPVIAPDAANRYEPFPLTDVQAAYLVGRQQGYAYGGVACHIYLEVEYPALDPVRAEEAWNRLIAHHDMLRLVVHQEGYQQVSPSVEPYRIPAVDLRGEGERAVEARLREVRDDLGQKIHPTGQWPLFELSITQTTGRAILHLSLDFLMADWTSIQRLLGQMDQLRADPDHALPPCEVTYRDYVLAERRLRESSRYQRDRDYWWARLDELPPAPELPTMTRAESPPSFHHHAGRLESAPWAAFREQATAAGLTASGAVLAAFAEVVGRWSRRPEFTLNLTLHNRLPLHPRIDALFGDFTSVVLLAVQGGGASFAERARRLGQQLFDDMDHRLCSGIEVIRELARRRGRDEAVMPVVYTSAIGGSEDEATRTTGEIGYSVTQTPQVWIDCQVMERNGALLLNWNVRDDVFPPGLVEEMFAAFESLLRRLADGAAAWSAGEPVALPAAQAERRAAVNATAGELPSFLLHEPVFETARRYPDRMAVVDAAGTHSYRALGGRAAAIEAALRAAGAAPGDIVAVVLDKGFDQIAAVLGVLAAGAAYLPIDVGQPTARRDVILGDSGARFVVTASADDSVPPRVRGLALDAVPAAETPPGVPGRRVGPDDLAYVIYTSGSTGTPKGVMITHRAAANTIADVNERFDVQPGDRVLGLAHLGFDLSVYDIFGPLGLGGLLVLPDPGRRGDPGHWAELVERHGVTVWNSVPAQLQMLGHYLAARPGGGTGSLRLALLSGDWIPVTLPDEIRSRVPNMRLVSLGGATEASIWSIHYPIDEVDPEAPSIPYGFPLRNQTFHVLDQAMRDCPDWVAGELHIGGDGLARGYLNDPGRTEERFLTHPVTGRRLYRTGDLGRYLPGGAIEFLGREDHQVKIRGHRVELAEVEAALLSHPTVRGAVVLADGSDTLRRRLVAFVEWDERGPGQEGPRLDEHVRELLPEYMCPAVVHPLPALPVTGNGKVDRGALTARLAEIADLSVTPASHAPREGLETTLAELWAEVLNVESVGRNDDFFALGGNSLLSTQLVAEVRARVPQAAGMFFDSLVRQLLPEPTVAAMARHLEEARADAPPTEADSGRTSSPLRRLGNGDTGPTVLLVHDGTGELDRYQQLADLLDPGRRVLGLSVGHADGYLRVSDESLARRRTTGYARLVHAEAPGEIRVVGAGATAVLALGVADALRELGGEPGEVVLVDGYRVDERATDELWLEALFAGELGLRAEEFGYPAEGLAGADRPLPRRAERLAALGRAARLRARTPVTTRLDVFRKSVDALRDWPPTAYPGPVRLLDTGAVPNALGKALFAELTAAGCPDVEVVAHDRLPVMGALAALLEEAAR
ncbi:non-ribosomal peptide synthetase [Streptomyces profundus]|uniref:non-ribosomal peptide synthetase n=1 Tax=Streptomyces profundus TaxID=2867410 RepID=UPI001D15EBCA|nr:non-ribosomal peptide synthetase [Streptomyces sp. MA3_2.13]UED88034.1 amino acid adenylation domain-containing protein [Streptomyces sp. MA3_2.13]